MVIFKSLHFILANIDDFKFEKNIIIIQIKCRYASNLIRFLT